MSFNGAGAFAPQPAAHWNPMCEGCGAPLLRSEAHCSWCKRAAPMPPEMKPDWLAWMEQYRRFPVRAVASGLITVNQARAVLGLPLLHEWDELNDPSYGGRPLSAEWDETDDPSYGGTPFDPHKHTRSSGPK